MQAALVRNQEVTLSPIFGESEPFDGVDHLDLLLEIGYAGQLGLEPLLREGCEGRQVR